MRNLSKLGAVAAIAIAVAAPAQQAVSPAQAQQLYEKGYNGPRSPDAPAVNAVEGPVTDALNSQVQANLEGTKIVNAEAQARYSNDMAAYRAAVQANAKAAMSDQARYDNQQRAYADAMFAYRLQVAACQRGRVKACKAPAPDPADFY